MLGKERPKPGVQGEGGLELRNLSRPLCYSRDRDQTSLDIAAPIKAGGTEVRNRKGFLDSEVCSAWKCGKSPAENLKAGGGTGLPLS